MGAKKWAVSSNGPDAIDWMALGKAIGSLHSARVEVVLQLSGTGFTPYANVVCRATFELLPGSALPKEVVVEHRWPCSEHQTLDAHIYDGLYKLDFAISEVYKNEKLWHN